MNMMIIMSKAKKYGKQAVQAVKDGFEQYGIKGALAALIAFVVSHASTAQAAVDTSALDGVVTDATTWITYGVTSFLALLGAGLTIVAASWVYKKVKGAIKSN